MTRVIVISRGKEYNLDDTLKRYCDNRVDKRSPCVSFASYRGRKREEPRTVVVISNRDGEVSKLC